LSSPWSAVAGIVGAVVAGFLFINFGTAVVSEGPLPVISFLAAFIGALAVVIIARMIKK
jgi:uncharacterized membrane protein YeaQ/YmgE (transglycosylase-associated protein family)